MSTPLDVPSVPRNDVVVAKLTEIVCSCDYSCAAHLDNGNFPEYWQCPDCGKAWTREHIQKLRRLVSSAYQDMKYTDENHPAAHVRHGLVFRFTDPQAQSVLDVEVGRMESIKREAGFASYLHEITDRLKAWELATDAKPEKNLTESMEGGR